MMRRVVAESLRAARSQPIVTAITSILVATVSVTIMTTTGRVARAEGEVLERFEAAGSRTVVFADNNGAAGLTGDSVARLAALSDFQWVVGLGPAQDGRNAAFAQAARPVAVRAIYGVLEPIVTVEGRPLGSDLSAIGGEAQATAGMQEPAGELILDDDSALAVVARLEAQPPVEFLTQTVIHRLGDPKAEVRAVYGVVGNPNWLDRAVAAGLAVLDPVDASGVAVTTSADIAELRSVVAGDLGRFSRQLLLAVLSSGLLLVAAITYTTTVLRRRDFGRRRALGATRSLIVSLVAGTTLTAAVIGATAGIAVATAWEILITDKPPDFAFAVATAILVILSSVMASIPPAIAAANRDPVRILRVP